ncbi:nitroreductase family protein [Gynuella sp.]|uniref:nitroreductase family protein n=1 Tax=Gynuella sp. TaxID=2969146 RepID=UPI003D130505
MNSWKRTGVDYWRLSSELIFYYHKIEKGLSLPGEKRFFGSPAAVKVVSLINEWKISGLSQDDPIFLGAIESLRKYLERFPENTTEEQSALFASISELTENHLPCHELSTPYQPSTNEMEKPDIVLSALAKQRRSVRNFKDKKVDIAIVREALLIAQQAPSACNRQATRVHLYEQSPLMQELLKLQNGNRGFGHKIPLLAIITSESSTFFDFTERNEPYLDGGLFLGFFLLGLQSLGLSSCCLNWCTTPWHDSEVRKLTKIAPSEKILTFLAIGYESADSVVPRSSRRKLDSIVSTNI